MEEKDLSQDNFLAIVLCAGLGSRMGELANICPKPLLKPESLNGKSILQVSIENLSKFDFKEIFVVIGHLKEQITNFVKELSLKVNIVDSKEEYKKGPLDSLLSALKSCKISEYRKEKEKKKHILVLPGDTIFDEALINAIISKLQRTSTNSKEKPTLFFREITTNYLRESLKCHKLPFLFSTISFKKDQDIIFVDTIKQLSLESLNKSESQVQQVIPIFAFPISFIERILALEPKLKERTLVALINHSLSNGEEILGLKLDPNLHFYDIDEKGDLNAIH
ncbi:MAG: NTP transferase domain-containing protein [Candidatus Lokiarchaeota archaeon]|nr:NTP transferase domain-containing protein [Candidatus Lokiarchaeota archaeon]